MAVLALLLLAAAPAWGARRGADSLSAVSLHEVLQVIGREYVAPASLRPLALLDGALDAASAEVPSLVYERPADGDTLRVQVGPHARRWNLSGVTDLARLTPVLEGVRDFIRANVSAADRPAHLDAILTEGLLHTLDVHSALLSAAAYGDFQSQASGRIGGLGMMLVQPGGNLSVESVLPDSPAERAGVRAGDRILQIGDQTALHLPVEDALGLIRGPVGSRVDLLILRPKGTAPHALTLRRSDLHFASVTGRLFHEGGGERIGYLRIRSFQDTTTGELSDHLARMGVDRPGLLGLVLDLRDNPGGVLDQAIRVADLFLERGTIVTLRGPRLDDTPVQASWYRSVSSAPLIVLVDGGTASAAEVVAAALKDNHRALLIGAPTFGKNSVQSVFPLSGGNALKLTVARFFPLDGRSIAGRGILPHLWLRPVHLRPGNWGSGPDADSGLLATALGTAMERLDKAESGDGQPLRELPYLVSARPGHDFALALAKRLLLLNAPQGQALLLSQALDLARKARQQQDLAITRRLGDEGVDWSPGDGDESGQAELVRVDLETRRGPHGPWHALGAGEGVSTGGPLRLVFTVRNPAAAPLHRVLLMTQSAAPGLNGLELPVGLLPAESTVRVSAVADLPADQPQGLEPLRLRIYDALGQLQYRATVLIPFVRAPRVRLQLALRVFDNGTGGSRGNGDGRAQPGEVLALRVRLHNAGTAPSGAGRYWLSAQGPAPVRWLRPWRAFRALAPGATDGAYLRFSVSAPGQAVELRLNLTSDGLYAQELSWPFLLRPSQPLPRLTLQAPRVQLSVPETVEGETHVTVQGEAVDKSAMRDVVIFRNGHKTAYLAAGNAARTMPLRLHLNLEPGRNLVRIVARDRDGLVTRRSYLLWQGPNPGVPIGVATDGGT